MRTQSSRRHDEIVEKNIQKHLNKLYNDNNLKYDRVDDIKLQKRGVDLFIFDNDKKIPVDEKSASTYYKKHLKTFSFELSTNNNYNSHGWFDPDNKNMITEYYFLVYPFAPNNPEHDTLKNIDEIEVIGISKKKLWKYLNENKIYGLENVETTLNKSGKLVSDNNGYHERIIYDVNHDIRFVHSIWLREQPINIVISRKVLRKLADYRFYDKPQV